MQINKGVRMGTDLENVLEDIRSLMEHLKYFSECNGNLNPKMRSDLEIHSEALIRLAKQIQDLK